jgi:Fe-S cluster biosynthesis and repair protein YggX
MDVVETQLDEGKQVDVAQHLDQDIKEKFDGEDTTNFVDELQNDTEIQKDVQFKQALDNEIDDAVSEEADINFVDDEIMTTYKEDVRLADDEEAQLLMKEIEELESGSDAYGKAMEEAEAPTDTKFKAQTMHIGDETINKTDFDLVKAYQKTREWNRNNPTKKRPISPKQEEAYKNHSNIADDIKDADFTSIAESEMAFAKFADNLAAGTVAGVETDEEGNITFDPAKFVAGLGGYTAVKAAYKAGVFDNLPEEVNKWAEKQFRVSMFPRIVDDADKPKGLLAKAKERTQAKIDKGIIPEAGRRVQHPESTQGYYYLGDSGKVYFNARDKWFEMPNQEVIDEVNEIAEIGLNAFKEKRKVKDEAFNVAMKEAETREAAQVESYKDQHTAPTRDQDNATSIDDLTAIYPSDVYGNQAARYYGHGDEKQDREAIRILQRLKGKPKAKVKIYRSIPSDIDADINEGDWVTITKQYAIEHAENRFDGKYKLLEKEVNAEDIITDGNSIHEQGYDPKKETK